MTVCIATDTFYPQVGGIATFYNNLCLLLKESNVNVIVLTVSYEENAALLNDEIIEEDTFIKVTLKKTYVRYYNYYKQYFRPGGIQAPGWISIGMAMREWLISNYKLYKIDIIEVSDYGGIGFFLCDNDLPPVVITGHGCLDQNAHYNYMGNSEQVRLIRKLEKLAFQLADGIIAHSKLNQVDLETITGRKVFFATAPLINTVNDIYALPENNHSLLVIGGMQIVKGAITMAAAIEICVIQEPDVKLYWIGSDFYVAPGMQLMSVYLQKNYPHIWNKNFIWLNEQNRENTLQILMQSSIVVIPSDWETFNYVALEAAAFNKPVIISDKAGASYLFKNNETAMIVPGKDPMALANAILRLMKDFPMQKRLGNNAKLMIESSFMANKVLKERMTVYEEIIQNRIDHSDSFEQRKSFLNIYFARYRKYFFQIRSVLKRFMGR